MSIPQAPTFDTNAVKTRFPGRELTPGRNHHPLDQLTAEEIGAAAAACRERAASLGLPVLRFNSISAKEPHKYKVLAYLKGGAKPARQALCVVQAPPRNSVFEALVDLDGTRASILSWQELEGVQPAVTLDDVIDVEKMVKANKEFQDFVARRYGITDLEEVAVDPWYSGQRYGATEGRIIQCFLYQRTGKYDNFYAHPLDTVLMYNASVDRVSKFCVYGDENTKQDVPLAAADFSRHVLARPFRGGMRPLHVVQPEGPSFTVKGSAVEWQNWSFQVGFSWREGLVLHGLGYKDGGRVRPVIYRAALAEIIVPYAEPRPPYETKCAYDIMDYGLGFCANSLELGCDCLGHIHYFDASLNDALGRAVTLRKAVCMHEEDAGMAWKHYDYRTDEVEVRRMRRLVLSFIATIANYEYGFYWHLYQDGSIQFEVKLTGIVSTSPLHAEEVLRGPDYGTLVAPGVNAAHHQHFFITRLDMAVDDEDGGRGLSVVEMEAVPMGPGDGPNPFKHGFKAVERVLETELAAQRDCDAARSRAWKIMNPRVINPLSGKPVSWKLMPTTASPPMLAGVGSDHYERGFFATKHLWVTPYAEDEMNPAGEYPHDPRPQANGGIRAWTKADRPVADADVVVWFNVGLTHFVRTEDFPVMPVEQIGFHLKPYHFFDVNPAIDIPPERDPRSVQAKPCCDETPLPSRAGPALPRM
ncbi:AMX1 [Auxenochlorella protothecoides x Auxenochlorella symbiontica]